ncbi:restriction endonuclease subunit S [Thermomonas paludicola]|uniref:restriction endonuclease subunit S n=1 Tax=Thermomonas paludicola TaxID=2884874 RepID=UPI002113CDE2|nr:restriction endonuclease subunit S [Thermomonas paludicola]
MSLPRYPEYKPSGVEWIGDIPSHWAVTPISVLATLNDETLPESTDPELEIEYVDIGSVSLTRGIERSEPMTFSNAPSRARRIVRDGDVLVSTVRTYLKAIAPVALPAPNLIASTGFAVVRPKSGQYSGYLKYGLQCEAFVHQVIARSTGVSYPAINASELARIPLWTPSFGEQYAIASFLDRETAKIDALITEQEKLLALLAEKRQATISHSVTRGLDPNAPMKDSGIPWLGEVPAQWDLPPLYLRYSSELGKMLDTDRITGRYLVSYLRNVDVQWDAINYENLPAMDIKPDEIARYTVRDGDLLVCEGGEVGRTAVVNVGDSVIGYQKALHRLRALSESECPRYMFYIFSWASKAGAFAGEGQATIAHLTGEQLRRYRFPRPSKVEQEAISEFLDDALAKLAKLSEEAENGIALLKERRSALIAAAVTGQIDVRGAVESQAA